MKKAQKFLVGLLFLIMAAGQAWAQTALLAVPYRFTADSGEEVELVVYYTAGYKAVEHYGFNTTVVHPNGNITMALTANEAGGKIKLALKVLDNKVTDTTVTSAGLPAGSKVLSINSRSGEKLSFTFTGPKPTVTSDRIK
ncbi:MAG: hypothetical protein HQL20_01010 [Candidatus Omnitrophica bacterium]|nr:hypothetical protein [Candidatus Omnitrophota bacterium]